MSAELTEGIRAEQTARLDALSIDDLSTNTPTPTASASNDPEPGSNPLDFLDTDKIAGRWAEALERCRQKLSANDFQIVSSFDSPEKLRDDLENRQQEHSATGMSRLLHQVYPTSSSLREIITQFIALMLPRSVTTGLLWGTLYLVLKLAGKYDSTSRRVATMLKQIRRQLALLNHYAQNITNQEEIRIALVDVFEVLIYFWVDAVSYFRSNSVEKMALGTWPKLEQSFKETMTQIDEAMMHLQHLLPFSAASRSQNIILPSGSSLLETGETTEFPIYQLPAEKTTVFVGREELLETIDQHFKQPPSEPRLRIFSLFGLGGVGKTELALAYAREHRTEYEAIFWIRGESPKSLQQSFTSISLDLQLPGAKPDGDAGYNLLLVQRWLRITQRRWLLIFDNVENYQHLDNYLPLNSDGSVLLTTRYPIQAEASGQQNAVVSPFNKEEGQRLFEQLLGWKTTDDISKPQRQAATSLLDRLGGLVLGIHHMASLIRFRGQTRNVKRFLDTYEKYPHKVHEKNPGVGGHTLKTLWQITFDEIRSTNSSTLLGVLACLSPDVIPRDLFLPSDPDHLKGCLSFCSDEFEVDDAIDMLKQVGLIDRNDDVLSLHRLVQAAFIFHLGEEDRQQAFNSAAYLVNQAFPKQVKGRLFFANWKQCQAYIQHGLSLSYLFAKLGTSNLAVETCDDFVELLTNCAWYMFESGSNRENLVLLETAYAACPDKDSLRYAHLLNTASQTYYGLNDLEHSREALERSKAIREALLGAKDEELGNTYNNLGIVESAEGRLDNAIEYFQRANETRAHLSEEEGLFATTLMNTGRAFFLKRDYEAAANAYSKAERIFSLKFGADSFAIQGAYFAWGNLHLAKGDLSAARKSFQGCINILLKHNPTHIFVASTYYKLGCVEMNLQHYRESMNFLDRALLVARARNPDGLGEEARILRKQAMLMEAVSRLPESEQGEELEGLADLTEAERLKGAAELLRKNLEGKKYHGYVEDEDVAYERLVNPFKR